MNREWKDVVSLFIDGLPLDMTWDWLLQIFRGEEEVTDVYVSYKRQRNNETCFGFVRFKKMEEAKNVVRNLNGIKIRGKILKVSFAKYDKKGMPWIAQFCRKEIMMLKLWEKQREPRKFLLMGGVLKRWWKDHLSI